MRIFIVIALTIILLENTNSQPLHSKKSHSIIIDTDCAIDDMRAISFLLSLPEISVKAILLSDGSLSPKDGLEKVSSLLHEFKCDSIPVASGDVINTVIPPWREFNKQISWGTQKISLKSEILSNDLLSMAINNSEEKLILVCLGPLTNIAQFVKNHSAELNKIERILWYNESALLTSGFNYEYDKNAASIVFNSGVRIDVISNLRFENACFDATMYLTCKLSETQLGSILYKVHSQKPVLRKLEENHFNYCDELVVVYLTNPELFDINLRIDKLKLRFNSDYNISGVKDVMSDMINGTYTSEQNVVFNKFPVNKELFNYDIRPIIDSAIALYGMEEWKANVMTDEFHGHLGVFSIVGSKMGIRAREYFNVGPDMLTVTVYSGSKPPYSCLIDGIQVSTGATLGMGTIAIAQDSIARPSAVFSYKNKSIRITLKPEYLAIVDADIKEGIVKFGLLDDGYWKLIRRNALKYWLEWDRNEIFELTPITP